MCFNETDRLFDAIVPIYNEYMEECPLFELLTKNNGYNVQLYICDNSTKQDIKKRNAATAGSFAWCTYLDMLGNMGYSKACNRAISESSSPFVCIFDDDTIIPYDYFSKVLSWIKRGDLTSTVYVPIVLSGEELLSPLKTIGPMIYRASKVGDIDPSSCSAFNTGMVISRDVFSSVSYDENLFLEFVDHAFCRDAHKVGAHFVLMDDVHLEQSYSVYTNDLNSALFRDSIGKKDVREYYSHGLMERIYGQFYLAYRFLRNSIRYRTFKFAFNS